MNREKCSIERRRVGNYLTPWSEKSIEILASNQGNCEPDYDALRIHLDINMTLGYKLSKFDIYDEKGNPHVHLRALCDKLVDLGRNEKLRMKLFI